MTSQKQYAVQCPHCKHMLQLRVTTGLSITKEIYIHGQWVKYNNPNEKNHRCDHCSMQVKEK